MNKSKKSKPQKENKKILGIHYYEIIILVLFLGLLIFLLITKDHNNLKAHCAKAICNEDNTICYNYSENKDGKTIKTWKGNCSVLK